MESHEIIYNDVPLTVTGCYEAGEPQQWYDINGEPGYPSNSASFEIESIEVNEVDIKELLSEQQQTEIELLIIKRYE